MMEAKDYLYVSEHMWAVSFGRVIHSGFVGEDSAEALEFRPWPLSHQVVERCHSTMRLGRWERDPCGGDSLGLHIEDWDCDGSSV